MYGNEWKRLEARRPITDSLQLATRLRFQSLALSGANVPRNDTSCRIATLPSVARNDDVKVFEELA